MKLSLEKRKKITKILGTDYEEKESSIVFKISDKKVLLKLISRGYVNIFNGIKFLDFLKKYDCVIYGSVLYEYDNAPIYINSIKLFNPTLEDCKKMTEIFSLVMHYADGSYVFMGLKK